MATAMPRSTSTTATAGPVQGNVFARCGDPGRGSFGTVFSHGGHDIRAENNVFVDCKRALARHPGMMPLAQCPQRRRSLLLPRQAAQRGGHHQATLCDALPGAGEHMDPPPGAKRVNRAKLNCVRALQTGLLRNCNSSLAPTVHDHDPGFVNLDKANYRLLPARRCSIS